MRVILLFLVALLIHTFLFIRESFFLQVHILTAFEQFYFYYISQKRPLKKLKFFSIFLNFFLHIFKKILSTTSINIVERISQIHSHIKLMNNLPIICNKRLPVSYFLHCSTTVPPCPEDSLCIRAIRYANRHRLRIHASSMRREFRIPHY